MTAAAIVSLLAEVSWRAVVVAALVGVALTVWRVRSGAVRHAAWTAVAVVFLLMPVLLPVTPVLTIPVAAPLPVRDLAAPDSGGSVVSPTPIAAAPTAAPATGSRSGVRPSSPVVERALVGTVGQSDLSPSREAWLVAIWLVGMTVSLVWLAVGWRWARRLAATGRVSEVDPRVYESPALTSPCAVGVWRGRVLVPSSWRLWPVQRRMMVVTHELAHLERRDGLIALMARLTRAVFWFHPLAWWLERRIAVAAEQACDERVLDAGHDAETYAQLLVDSASVMRRRRGHAAWASLGMAGGRQMGRRLDRVLSGRLVRMRVSRMLGVATTVLVCVAAGVACGPRPAALQPDPDVTRQIEAQRARQVRWDALKTMTKEDAAALLQQFRANPDDLQTAETLRWYYRTRWEGQMTWAEARDVLRFVWLATIERHPESPSIEWRLTAAEDPEGHAQAAVLWESHLKNPTVSARVYRNAVRFIEATDRPAPSDC